MYDDAWYSIVPDSLSRRDDTAASGTKHKRRESLLQQANDAPQLLSKPGESLAELLEETSLLKGPPEPTVLQRANSYSDFHKAVRAEVTKDAKIAKLESNHELSILNSSLDQPLIDDWYDTGLEDDLLDASQEEFILYRDQLRLTERHLDTLIQDTTSALDLLAGLSDSFDTVEKETNAFQSQCQVLLDDQKHLKNLKDEVGDDLHYYSYLEPITRRLNAPGASRLVRDESFADMLTNLNNCIWFMSKHPEHRDSETYLSRYSSLLLRALSLFESQFLKDLNERAEDIRKRRAEGSLTNATLHALIYRPLSEEMEENLRLIGALAVNDGESDDTPNRTPFAEEHESLRPSPATALAKDQVKNLLQGIVNWRRDLHTPTVQDLLQTLNTAFDKQEDPMKVSRTCIKAMLDLCKDELKSIHRYFIEDFWKVYGYTDNAADYTIYLREFCRQLGAAVRHIVERMDLLDAVELAGWIERCYSPDFDQYNSGREEEDTVLFETHRREMTLKLSKDVKETILSRFAEITLRQIQKYEASQEDLQCAPHYPDPSKNPLSGNMSEVEVSDTRKIPSAKHDSLDSRAIELIGEGYMVAYPPVKSAIRMLILHNELFPFSEDESHLPQDFKDIVEKSRFEIIHRTTIAVEDASRRIAVTRGKYSDPPTTPTKGLQPILPDAYAKGQLLERKFGFHNFLFVIHNLYLLKQLIMLYDYHGVTRTSQLDFSDVFQSLRDILSRGQLLDPRAYFDLVSEGKLRPKIVETIHDARDELDGYLLEHIVRFTEGWAEPIIIQWRKEGRTDGGEVDDGSFWKLRWLLNWTLVGEDRLKEALVLAVAELCKKRAPAASGEPEWDSLY